MFRPNNNFNQYYGNSNNLFSPRHNSIKKLKRTQLSGQKLSLSKRSDSSQSSLVNSKKIKLVTESHKSKHLQMGNKKYANIRNFNNEFQQFQKLIHVKSENILDAFKIKVPHEKQKNFDLKKKKDSKKFIEDFDSYKINPYLQENNQFKQTHKHKNRRHNQHLHSYRQSPLKKLLKSKRKLDSQSPFNKMVQNVRNSQKQCWSEQEKTIKHIRRYAQVDSQLNQTNLQNNYLNYLQIMKENAKNNKYQHHQKDNQHKKRQKSKRSFDQIKLNKFKSQKLIMNKQRQKLPISSSKIRNFFAKKKQNQRKANFMKQIFNKHNTFQQKNQISKHGLHLKSSKILGESQKLSQYPELKMSQCSSVSKSEKNQNQLRYNLNQKHQTDAYQIDELSDYGIESSHFSSRKYIEPKQKVQNKNQINVPMSPAGQLIQSIRSFQDIDNQYLKSNKSHENVSSSIISIQSSQGFQTPIKKNNQQKLGQNLWRSEQYIITLKQSKDNNKVVKKEESEIKQQSSINVASNRNRRKPIKIITQLQKDIKADQSKLKKSKLTTQSKLLKNSGKMSSIISKQTSKKQPSNLLKVQKQSQNELSNLIHNSSPSINQKIYNQISKSQSNQQKLKQQLNKTQEQKNPQIRILSEQATQSVNYGRKSNQMNVRNSNSEVKIKVDSSIKTSQFMANSQQLPQSSIVKKLSHKSDSSNSNSNSNSISINSFKKQIQIQSKNSMQSSNNSNSQSQSNSPMTLSSKTSKSKLQKFQMKEIEQDDVSSQQYSSQSLREQVSPFKKVKISQSQIKQVEKSNKSKSNVKKQSQLSQLNRSSKLINSFKNLSLSSRNNFSLNNSERIYQIKTFDKKKVSDFTLNDVLYRIQQHQLRIGSFSLYVDNTKAIYHDEEYLIIKYELLNFLMMKKYLYEQYRVIQSLKSNTNIFIFTQIQIPTQVLNQNRGRQQVTQRLQMLIQANISIQKQFTQMYESLLPKFEKQKLFNKNYQIDNFSKEIIKRMMEELMSLYAKWQSIQEDTDKKMKYMFQERMMEIIEIIFLISELDKKPVKPCQLFVDENVDFHTYYETYYEKIIETLEYFQSKK